MKIAIMQPYLFPYIGYFQLMTAVDYFVIFDDVQYIKRGWINRNRILINKEAHLFSFSIKQDSRHLNINERLYSTNFFTEKNKFIRTLQYEYKRAPYYNEIIQLILKVFDSTSDNVSSFNALQLQEIAEYVGVKTKFLFSSELEISGQLKAEDRIIDICKYLGANQYINPIGGQTLYSKSHFLEEGITLNFLKTGHVVYKQFDHDFIPYLSIIDVLMFNSKENIANILKEYELI